MRTLDKQLLILSMRTSSAETCIDKDSARLTALSFPHVQWKSPQRRDYLARPVVASAVRGFRVDVLFIVNDSCVDLFQVVRLFSNCADRVDAHVPPLE